MILRETLLTISLGVAAGCGGGGSGTDMGADLAGPDLAQAPDLAPLSDKALCDDACAKLALCGVTNSKTCSTDCQTGPDSYKTCVRAANSDCSGILLCIYKALAPITCPGGGGVPMGTATCNEVATCEGNCNQMSAPPSCGCNCIAMLDPTKLLLLQINNQCALDRCPTECGPMGSGPACNTCFAQRCMDAHQPCVSN